MFTFRTKCYLLTIKRARRTTDKQRWWKKKYETGEGTSLWKGTASNFLSRCFTFTLQNIQIEFVIPLKWETQYKVEREKKITPKWFLFGLLANDPCLYSKFPKKKKHRRDNTNTNYKLVRIVKIVCNIKKKHPQVWIR